MKNSVVQEIKKSYKIPIVIFFFVSVIATGSEFQADIFEKYDIFGFLMVALPLVTAIASFVVSNRYGDSRVFGKSYFLLGCGFVSMFLGELLYFVYGGKVDSNVLDLFHYFFFLGYLFTAFHIIINVRYLVEKIEIWQKMIVVIIPLLIISGYSYLVYENLGDLDYFYFNLLFVSASAANLGLAIVGFTLFRHTVLISAWFLLLIGIFIGTIGHLEFRYYHALGDVPIGNHSLILWFSSFVLMIFALYRHHKIM